MIAYRLAKAAFAALDGEGARLYGGRWNRPGAPMIYTSASPGLAVLEVLVHLDLAPELFPDDYRLLGVFVPDEAPVQRLERTPGETGACRKVGDDFLAAGQALVLSVPSIVVPQERNALINPRHPAAVDLRIASNEPFRFDPRLLKGS